MANNNGTPFSIIYDSFLSKVTDDMYMELTEVETFELLQELLLSAIPHFEFPRVNLSDFEVEYVEDETTYCGVESGGEEVPAYIKAGGCFNAVLNNEEVNILSTNTLDAIVISSLNPYLSINLIISSLASSSILIPLFICKFFCMLSKSFLLNLFYSF